MRLATLPIVNPIAARPMSGAWNSCDCGPAKTGLRKSLKTWMVFGSGNSSGHATTTARTPRMTTGMSIALPASFTAKTRAVCGSPWNTVK